MNIEDLISSAVAAGVADGIAQAVAGGQVRPETYSVAELSIVLGISERTIRDRIADGTIPTVSRSLTGTHHRIPRSWVDGVLATASLDSFGAAGRHPIGEPLAAVPG